MTTTIRIGLYRASPLLLTVPDGEGHVSVTFPADFDLGVIAHGLSLLNRFTGQTPRTYTVAEHSIRLARWLGREGEVDEIRRAALLHDAGETLGVNDLQTFIKRRFAPSLAGVEHALGAWLWAMYGDSSRSWADVEAVIKPVDKALGDHEFHTFGLAGPKAPEYAPAVYRPYIPTTHGNTAAEIRRLWVREWVDAGGRWDGPEEWA